MNELLTETSSSTQSGEIWGQLLLAAILILLVNAVIFYLSESCRLEGFVEQTSSLECAVSSFLILMKTFYS